MQLTDEERVYLNAAALGDVGCIRLTLEEADEDSNEKKDGEEVHQPSPSINLNCTDYMGRCGPPSPASSRLHTHLHQFSYLYLIIT